MTPPPQEKGPPCLDQGMSRRGFVRNSALIGGLAALGGALPGTAAAATTSSTSAVPRAGAQSAAARSTSRTGTTSRSRSPTTSCSSSRPTSSRSSSAATTTAGSRPGTSTPSTATRSAARFPGVKIKYATWDYPIRYEDIAKTTRVPGPDPGGPAAADRPRPRAARLGPGHDRVGTAGRDRPDHAERRLGRAGEVALGRRAVRRPGVHRREPAVLQQADLRQVRGASTPGWVRRTTTSTSWPSG